jgi:Transposase DDE domain
MQRHQTVALRERGRLATLVSTVVHQARRQAGWREPDRRTLRTWRQFVLGLVVARSTRLVAVGHAVLGQRAAQSVKAVAMALGYFLRMSTFPVPTVSAQVLEAAVRRLDPAQVATYRGKVVLALDPTDYPKRSRGRSKQGRHMEHVGRVRKPTKSGGGRHRGRRRQQPRPAADRPMGPKGPGAHTGTERAPVARVATTSGYVDVWAGLVLNGKHLLPLARALFSNRHPTLLSQNKIEEAVLDAAVALLERLGWAAILVADRGFGRKELLVALATRGGPPQDFVIRVDADVTVFTAALPAGALLGPVLAAQPSVGEVVWDRGQEGPLRCEARSVTATIRFSRTGRKDDYTAATLRFVELLPLDGVTDPLVLATTLPVDRLADVTGVVRVYSWRWAIETAFETMKAWGLGRFMVRSWQAIDRLLWLVAVAYALLVVAARDGPLAILREQAVALLKRLAVLGRRLTVGKLAEAIGLDYQRHRRAWATAWASLCLT